MRSINHLLEHLKKSVETGEPFFPQEHDIEMLERYTNTSTDLISRADAIEAVKFLTPYREYWKGTRKVLYKKEDVIKELKALPSADASQGWIPCSERLPKKGEVVLITNGKGNVRCGQYRSEHDVRGETHYWWWKGKTIESVLAWQPLPTPYKGGGAE